MEGGHQGGEWTKGEEEEESPRPPYHPELSMGWVDTWVGLSWVESRFFSFWWVGLGKSTIVLKIWSANSALIVDQRTAVVLGSGAVE